MTFQQLINWTVLPAGLSDDGTQARVSVFVAPRLQPDGERATLDAFGDFLTWPDVVNASTTTFEFATDDGDPQQLTAFSGALTPQGPAPDPHLWTGIFHGSTPVKPYDPSPPTSSPHAGLRTFSVARTGGLTRSIYARTARTWPEEVPGTLHALGVSPPPSQIPGNAVLGSVPPPSGRSQRDALAALDDLATFHSIPMSGAPAGQVVETVAASPGADAKPNAAPDTNAAQPEAASTPVAPDISDFHSVLSWLGDHPALLRRLGLVLDFLLPADRLPASSGDRLLRVVPHWTSKLTAASTDVPCRTRYVFRADQHIFVPAMADAGTLAEALAPPSRGLVAVGTAPVNTPAPEEPAASTDAGTPTGAAPPTDAPASTAPYYFLEQTDIDAAAMAMLKATDTSTGLSSVRSHGITLVLSGRSDVLSGEFDRATDLDRDFGQGARQNSPVGPVLGAEDVVRGHRMDIWDESRKQWFSLHERDVQYRLPNNGPLLLTASDEGFFQAHLASPAADDSVYQVPEHLATWEDWSLSAPRPGLVLDTEPAEPGQPPKPPVDQTSDAVQGAPLEITVTARPGSLPRLRFGAKYRVRLRTVDLAGNGLDLTAATGLTDPKPAAPTDPNSPAPTDPNSPAPTDPKPAAPTDPDSAVPMDPQDLTLPRGDLLTFHRFEAVPAPAVVPRLPFGEGASAYRMVIRSSPGTSPPPAVAPGT
ncbi:hypothetical protein ACFC0P_38820, partial [Streptomyces broussonetiae]